MNTTCSKGVCECGNDTSICGTICCAEGTVCGIDGNNYGTPTCQPIPTGCKSNGDCTSDQFCKIAINGCHTVTKGTCTSKSEYELTSVQFNGHTFYGAKDNYMNWWSADNLCKSYGKQLATLDSLGVSKNYFQGSESECSLGTEWCIVNPACKEIICDPTDTDEECVAKGCPKMGSPGPLYQEFSKVGLVSKNFWLKHEYDGNSCEASALNVYSNFNDVNFYGHMAGSYALCE